MEWYIVLLILLAVVFALQQLAGIRRSTENTEAMLGRLLAHHAIEWQKPSPPSEKVRALAPQPNAEIEAIRAYRQQTGLGLKEARGVIQSLRAKSEGDA